MKMSIHMNNQALAAKRLRQQGASMLVPILFIAIVIVLVLMWQAGMFGGSSSSAEENEGGALEATQSQAAAAMAPAEATAAETSAQPDRPLTDNEKAAQRVKDYKPSEARLTGTGITEFTDQSAPSSPKSTGGTTVAEDAAIDLAAQQLITSNRPDFSTCTGAADANQTLECAAKEQTRVLQAAFVEHNELRSAGDEISVEHGGAVMKQVIDALQAALEPFVAAANNP